LLVATNVAKFVSGRLENAALFAICIMFFARNLFDLLIFDRSDVLRHSFGRTLYGGVIGHLTNHRQGGINLRRQGGVGF
jgi:hypothetical protein